MAMTIPDGFRPHTLASLIARNLPLNESIGKDLAKLAEPVIDEKNKDIGSGLDLIAFMEEHGLIQFAEGPGGVPALFVAEDDQFPFPELRAVADRLLRYFASTGKFDTASGVIVDDETETPVGLDDWLDSHRHILSRVAAMARCSTRIVEETYREWDRDGKLLCRQRADGTYVWYVNSLSVDQGDRTRNAILAATRTFYVEKPPSGEASPPPDIYQHRSYMRAVEAQYAALTDLEEASATYARDEKARSKIQALLPTGASAATLWGYDIAALRAAETVCWFAEPLHAVDVAASSLLPATAIHRDMTTEAAGWWFFMEPYPIRTTRESQEIIALLWHWTVATRKGVPVPGVSFSAYVTGPNGKPTPSSLFFWPEAQSLDSLLALTGEQYESMYGKGANADLLAAAYGLGLLGREQMLHVVERLARFWAAGVVWINQKILTYTSGAIERHERKRLARGSFQRALTDVQVIELRRRMSVPMTEGGPTEHHNVDWQCRWIVRGHFREQWYPSTNEHRTIFIESYDKGPADLPLKVPTHTVYTVTR